MALLHTDDLNQPSTSAGVPLAGAKLYFYEPGTTTGITVYQDKALTTPHANPVVADASGIFAPIWVDTGTNGTYKTVLTDASDVTIRTVDNITAPLVPGATALTEPAAADKLPIVDASASDAVKEITLQNLWKVLNVLNAGTAPDKADKIALYDASGTAAISITLENLLKVINTLTVETTIAVGDTLAVYDASASASRRMTVQTLFNAINVLTAETSPAATDALALYDADGSATDQISLTNLFKVINEFTEDSAPDAGADYAAVYDASASAVKKVLLRRLGGFVDHPDNPKATTSGTQHDFSSIPAGTERIQLFFSGNSLNSSDDILVRLGDSGGIETTSYTQSYMADVSNVITNTDGFRVFRGAGGDVAYGHLDLWHLGSNVWSMSYMIRSDGNDIWKSTGEKTLTGELTDVRVRSDNGTSTFDAGNLYLKYQ